MKVALHNAFHGQQVAETELCRRLIVAATRLGWEAKEVASSEEILAWRPDFVLALHFFTSKLTPFPTYGCMWHPSAWMEQDISYVRNVLGYDAYLPSSERAAQWIRDLLHGLPKPTFLAPMYASCPARPWRAPLLDAPRLAYLGTNWDAGRHCHLFPQLADRSFVDFYGPDKGWKKAAAAYRGQLPFDGETVLDVLNRSGAGLCLHHPAHREAGVPSMRIFEIVASGAVAVCGDHPFIREKFGDSVLYVDENLESQQLATQIDGHMEWIAAHREEALRMSRRAHDVFARELSLDVVLEELGRQHMKFVDQQARQGALRPPSKGRVDVVVRTGTRAPAMLSRTLESIAAQSYPDVRAVIVRHGPENIEPVLAAFRGRLETTVIELSHGSIRSTTLWAGLKAATGEYVGMLDDDDVWFPDHLATLVPLIAPGRRTAVAYSGAVRRLEQDAVGGTPPPLEPAQVEFNKPFDRQALFSLHNYIHSSSWLARRELLDPVGDDPLLEVFEDLLLLIGFAQRTDFAFSGKITSQYFERTSRTDNTRYFASARWEDAGARIRRMIWKHGLAHPQAPLAGAG
jgi:hypothetical protein